RSQARHHGVTQEVEGVGNEVLDGEIYLGPVLRVRHGCADDYARGAIALHVHATLGNSVDLCIVLHKEPLLGLAVPVHDLPAWEVPTGDQVVDSICHNGQLFVAVSIGESVEGAE